MIQAVEYRPNSRELLVHMETGETRLHENVSSVAHMAFVTDPGMAHHYRKYIEPVYLQAERDEL